MISNTISRLFINGLKINQRASVISHLCSVDDKIIFTKATLEKASHLAYIMKKYEKALRQMINLNKSKFACSSNVPSPRQNELEMLLGVNAILSSMSYLGLPTIIGKSKIQIFQFARDQVWKKLKGWKAKYLSQVSKETLIKIVVQVIPSYVMGCFMLSNTICHQIESDYQVLLEWKHRGEQNSLLELAKIVKI